MDLGIIIMHIVFIGSFAGGGFLAGYLFANNKLTRRFEKDSKDRNDEDLI